MLKKYVQTLLIAFSLQQNLSNAFIALPSSGKSLPPSPSFLSVRQTTSLKAIEAVSVCKDQLLNLLSSTPAGLPTPKGMTMSILELVQQLEIKCPTPDERVLSSLQGSWELLWTAQDSSTPEANQPFLKSWIVNPLENQAFSNNPNGRTNPFLPVSLQDRLEALGLVSATPFRSTQAVDLKNGIIRNIVAFNVGRQRKIYDSKSPDSRSTSISRTFAQPCTKNMKPSSTQSPLSLPSRASVSVSIGFKPVAKDPRRVDVKFQSVRISVPGTPIEMTMPLGAAGPTGWLRTVYIDDDLRISRGHKGSVFVLKRPRRAIV